MDLNGKIVILIMALILFKYCSALGLVAGILNIRVVQIILYLSLYYIFIQAIKSEADLLYLFKWLWVGGLFVIGYGCYQLFSGSYTYVRWGKGLPFVLNEALQVNLYLIVFTLFVYLFQKNNIKFRFISVLVVLLYFLVALFTYKRGALLAGVIGFIFTILLMQRRKIVKNLLNLVLMGFFVFLVLFFVSQSSLVPQTGTTHLFTRLSAISLKNIDASGAMRVAEWIRSIEIMQANPIWGLAPLEGFTLSFGPYDLDTVLDCNYLYIGVLFGPLVLVLFIFIIGYTLVSGLKSIILIKDNSFLKAVIIGSVCAFISFLIADIFEVHISVPKVGPFYILVISLIYICKRITNSSNYNPVAKSN
jgi:hypothetical protein